jgi:hypothetical protein
MDVTIKAPDTAPAGTYPAAFEALEERTSREGVPFWRWSFTVRTPDGSRSISGASSTNTGPKSKSYRWFTALLGRRPAPNETLGANLAGRVCLVVLADGEDGYTDLVDILPAFPGAERPTLGLTAPASADEPPLPPDSQAL